MIVSWLDSSKPSNKSSEGASRAVPQLVVQAESDNSSESNRTAWWNLGDHSTTVDASSFISETHSYISLSRCGTPNTQADSTADDIMGLPKFTSRALQAGPKKSKADTVTSTGGDIYKTLYQTRAEMVMNLTTATFFANSDWQGYGGGAEPLYQVLEAMDPDAAIPEPLLLTSPSARLTSAIESDTDAPDIPQPEPEPTRLDQVRASARGSAGGLKIDTINLNRANNMYKQLAAMSPATGNKITVMMNGETVHIPISVTSRAPIWLHPETVSREDAAALVSEEGTARGTGTFLVRKMHNPGCFALTVYRPQGVLHHLIQYHHRTLKWSVNRQIFDDARTLSDVLQMRSNSLLVELRHPVRYVVHDRQV